MSDIAPVGNANAFLGTPFGWFCPRPFSLLSRRNVPLSTLLNVGRCECFWHDLALLLLLERGLARCLRITRHSLGYLCYQGQWAPFLYCGGSGALLGCYLACFFRQYRAFFLPGPANGRFHTVDVQCDLAIPSYVLPAPPISSPCIDASEEIDLPAIRSPGCWSLHMCQMNWMWGGEPLELLVAESYWIAVGAKPRCR